MIARYTALPQLLSRLSHPNPYSARFIRQALQSSSSPIPCKPLVARPVVKARDSKRRKAAKELYEDVDRRMQQDGNKEGMLAIQKAMQLFDCLVPVCGGDNDMYARESTLSLKQAYPSLNRFKHGHVLVPVQSALTITLPSADVSAVSTSTSVPSSLARVIPVEAQRRSCRYLTSGVQ